MFIINELFNCRHFYISKSLLFTQGQNSGALLYYWHSPIPTAKNNNMSCMADNNDDNNNNNNKISIYLSASHSLTHSLTISLAQRSYKMAFVFLFSRFLVIRTKPCARFREAERIGGHIDRAIRERTVQIMLGQRSDDPQRVTLHCVSISKTERYLRKLKEDGIHYTNLHIYSYTYTLHEWTDGRTDRRTDGRTDGQTDGRTDGWEGTKTLMYTKTQIYIHTKTFGLNSFITSMDKNRFSHKLTKLAKHKRYKNSCHPPNV